FMQELHERTMSENAKVSPASVHASKKRAAGCRVEAHMREEWLVPGKQREPVVPGGKVRGRQHTDSIRRHDPPDLGHEVVGIDYVLEHFSTMQRINRAGLERERLLVEVNHVRPNSIRLSQCDCLLR